MEEYKKYSETIDLINESIDIFSKQESITITVLNEKIEAPHYCDWNEEKPNWPNEHSSGVYFIFGKHENDEKKVILYIGQSNTIGSRLQDHLNEYRNVGWKEFKCELVTTISIDKHKELETFLIENLKGKIMLNNVKGNN